MSESESESELDLAAKKDKQQRERGASNRTPPVYSSELSWAQPCGFWRTKPTVHRSEPPRSSGVKGTREGGREDPEERPLRRGRTRIDSQGVCRSNPVIHTKRIEYTVS